MIQEDGYQILESKMNSNIKEDFEIIESISTFHHKSFLQEIKDNLQFYEMSVESLSKSCNISLFRLSALINGNATFDNVEVQIIKKRLHII